MICPPTAAFGDCALQGTPHSAKASPIAATRDTNEIRMSPPRQPSNHLFAENRRMFSAPIVKICERTERGQPKGGSRGQRGWHRGACDHAGRGCRWAVQASRKRRQCVRALEGYSPSKPIG